MNIYAKNFYFAKLVVLCKQLDGEILKLDEELTQDSNLSTTNKLDIKDKIKALETLHKQLESLNNEDCGISW